MTRTPTPGLDSEAWPLERVAEMYYILAESGDFDLQENFQMAEKVITKWIDWRKDYVFVGERSSDGCARLLSECGWTAYFGRD